MHVLPRDFLVGQDAEHLPRNVPAANRHNETSARRNGLAGLRGDKLCSRRGRGVGIGVNFNSHTRLFRAAGGCFKTVVSFICSNVLPFVSRTAVQTKGSEMAAAAA